MDHRVARAATVARRADDHPMAFGVLITFGKRK
jgi:hypothetical protein